MVIDVEVVVLVLREICVAVATLLSAEEASTFDSLRAAVDTEVAADVADTEVADIEVSETEAAEMEVFEETEVATAEEAAAVVVVTSVGAT